MSEVDFWKDEMGRHGVKGRDCGPHHKGCTVFKGEAIQNRIRKSLEIIEKNPYPIAVTELNCPPEILGLFERQFKEQGIPYKIEYGQILRKVTEEEVEQIKAGKWFIKENSFYRNF